MEISFVGKTALVTGAGKGVGRVTAKILATCGASVIALTRSQSDLDSLKEEIPNLKTICVDLLNVDEVIQAVENAGEINLLVNNAALYIGKNSLDVTKDDIDKSTLINVTVPLLLSQVVAKKLMKAGKSGAIVNVSTVMTGTGVPGLQPYVSVKSALESVTMALAVELAPHKIRVNSVLPGTINTPLFRELAKKNPEVKDMLIGRTPVGRPAEPEEIAQTIVYLLSDTASYITGQRIIADGGYSVR